jgi:hypothetical protein
MPIVDCHQMTVVSDQEFNRRNRIQEACLNDEPV